MHRAEVRNRFFARISHTFATRTYFNAALFAPAIVPDFPIRNGMAIFFFRSSRFRYVFDYRVRLGRKRPFLQILF